MPGSYIKPSRYPTGTLFCRQYAQHTDIINTMNFMHKIGLKPGGSEYVINFES